MDQEEKKITNDCYSDGDRKMMEVSQDIRAKVLLPFLYLLKKLKVSADMLTFLSLVAGILASVSVFYSKIWFLLLLVLHVLLDGLDGPLARYTKTASGKGSFTDTMCDQIVVALTTAVLIKLKIIYPIAGGVYIFVYTVVIAFSMVRNALQIPYSWLVRPRFFIYIWFIVEFYIFPKTINYILWIFIALLLHKMITGFVKIRRKI